MPIRAPNQGMNAQGTVPGSYSQLIGGNQAAMHDQTAAGAQDSTTVLPWVVLALVVAYVVYAVAIQHERISAAIRPANMAANAHNFVVVGLAASIFIVAMKVLWAKLTAFGFPLAAQIARFFMAV